VNAWAREKSWFDLTGLQPVGLRVSYVGPSEIAAMTTRSMLVLLIGLVGLGFAGCGHRQGDVPQPPTNQNWAILSKSDRGVKQFEGVWEPSESDVPALIQGVRKYLEELRKTASPHERADVADVVAAWDEYVCQVVGYTKDGKKLVRLNFVRIRRGDEEEFKDWRHRYIDVLDGGSDFWRIKYDTKAKRFFDFEVNGVA
jgi:hypothetical protein